MAGAPYILYIDTATDACSVCLALGVDIIHHEHEDEPRRHLSVLSPSIDRCFMNSGLTYHVLSAVCISSGPGSYTGLRTGYATAKGLCLALDIPLIEVPSLESIAYRMLQDPQVKDGGLSLYPMIDAGRDEICVSHYSPSGCLRTPSYNIDAAKWAVSQSPGYVAGSGRSKVSLHAVHTLLDIDHDARHLVHGGYLRYRHGILAELDYAEPTYMKPPYITVSKKAISAF